MSSDFMRKQEFNRRKYVNIFYREYRKRIEINMIRKQNSKNKRKKRGWREAKRKEAE